MQNSERRSVSLRNGDERDNTFHRFGATRLSGRGGEAGRRGGQTRVSAGVARHNEAHTMCEWIIGHHSLPDAQTTRLGPGQE